MAGSAATTPRWTVRAIRASPAAETAEEVPVMAEEVAAATEGAAVIDAARTRKNAGF